MGPAAQVFDRVYQITDRLNLGDPIERDRNIIEVFDRHDEIHHPQRVHPKVVDNVCAIVDMDRMTQDLSEDGGDVLARNVFGWFHRIFH